MAADGAEAGLDVDSGSCSGSGSGSGSGFGSGSGSGCDVAFAFGLDLDVDVDAEVDCAVVVVFVDVETGIVGGMGAAVSVPFRGAALTLLLGLLRGLPLVLPLVDRCSNTLALLRGFRGAL